MTAPEEPPVVELEELLGEQEGSPPVRATRQVGLIVVLAVVGLAAIATLAVLLGPAAAEVIRWIAALTRQLTG